MSIHQFLLFILLSMLFSCCNSTCNKCPFSPLESKLTRQRTQASSDFGSKLLVALKKLPIGPRIDVEVTENLAVDLSQVTDEYRYQPIDTILASSYNYQIEKICGLYKYVNSLPEGGDKIKNQQLLSQAIEQLFDFVDDYTAGRPVTPLSDDVVVHPPNGDRRVPGCSSYGAYETKIDSFLQEKIKMDYEKRSTWIKMKEAIPQYLLQCETNPNCNSCLEELWRELVRLDTSS